MSLLYPTENPTEYIISNCGKFGTDEIIDELIRCKDCKYKNSVHFGGWDVPVCKHGRGLPHIESDSYCSYAERKD